ncbi:MAG: CehA/McbA family metallohydrolase [Acidobacteriaceae bacterium]
MKLRTYLSLLLFLAGICLLHAQAPPEHGDLTLSGDIASSQTGSYVEAPFTVPPGVDRISIALSYTGKQDHSVLDLGLEDPDRPRGWSGGNKDHFTISVSDATPSYLPGPVVPGKWKLLLGVANIRTGKTVHYTAAISFLMAGAPHVDSFADEPLSTKPRWYRGDLHMHTGESDGSCTSQSGKSVPCPVFVTVQAAVARGLNFIAITDHNTTAQYNDERELQPFYDKLLLISGREITTYRGHANVYGTTRSLDFRVEAPGKPSVQSLLAQAQRLGALVSINHPVRNFGEACIGCGWKPAAGNDMRNVNAIEAVNGVNPQFYLNDIAYWQQQLNRGYRLTGLGGSDTHKPEQKTTGDPTTVVYASDLSVTAILDGIRAGRVFVDLTGSRDRMLEVEAVDDRGSTVHMGDTLASPHGRKAMLHVHVVGCAGSSVRITMDGETPAGLQPQPIATADQSVAVPWMSDGARHWIRADVLSSDGHLQLLGNPIYLNWNSAAATR